jgi:4-hydroxybenzoyl-CoA reductase subunit beta
MIALAPFTLIRPMSLGEAVRACAEPGARPIAGGTGLLPNLRLGIGAPRTLVSLEGLAELKRIDQSRGTWRIGAGVSLQTIANTLELPNALREAARAVAAPAHRAAATLGGNLCLDTRCVYYNQSEEWRRSNGYCLKHGGDTCHVAPQGRKCRAAYSADLAPALLVLGAEVEIASPNDVHVFPLEKLYVDDGAAHLRLSPGELVAAVRIPVPKGPSGYAKLRARGAMDYPLAGVAMALEWHDGRIARLRVALTGLGSRPVCFEGDETLAETLEKRVQKEAAPMRTTVCGADYRRQGAAILARRLFARLSEGGVP